MKCLILSIVFIFTAAVYAAEPLPYDQSLQKSICGGKIYPLCDRPDFNQETIYKAAFDFAKKTNRKLITILGFDECPFCLKLETVLHSDSAQEEKLNRNYVVVKLNSNIKSVQNVISQLKVKFLGSPSIIILDSSNQMKVFFPGQTTLENLMNKIDSITLGVELVEKHDKSEKDWVQLCQNFKGHYCKSYVSFLISNGKLNEAEKIINMTDRDQKTLSLIDFLKNPKSDQLKQKVYEAHSEFAQTDMHSWFLVSVIFQEQSKMKDKVIVDEILKSINQAGFDSCSERVLNSQVYSYIADLLNQKALAANIRLATASVGFVCKSSKK